MSWIRRLTTPLGALLGRGRMERELDEELRFHLEREAEERVRQGMSPAQARRTALRDFGGVERYKEECRDVRGVRALEELWQDVRYGARALRKHPGFTLVAAGSLALAIGTNTAVFTLVNGLFLRPLPVPGADQLVRAYAYGARGQDEYGQFSYPDYLDYRARVGAFAGLVAFTNNSFGLTVNGHAEAAAGFVVSGNYFDVLGVRMALGRGFTREEDVSPGAAPTIVISDALWRRRFAADPRVVGRAVKLNGTPCTVVGVAPKWFTGTETIFAADVWVPALAYAQVRHNPELARGRGVAWLNGLGRLRPGLDVRQAEAAMNVVARNLERAYPATNAGVSARILPERAARPEPGIPTALISALITTVAAIVLLVACANVANLMLVRAAGRRKEISVRLALGAGRARIVRQLLTESLLLALLAAVVGVVLARWANNSLHLISPPVDIPFVFSPAPDARVLGFVLLVTVATPLLFGLAPALSAVRGGVAATIKAEATVGGHGRRRARNALVVSQLALSLVLLVGAALFSRSLEQAKRIDPGFDPRQGLTAQLDLRFVQRDSVRGRWFFADVLERIGAIPGVRTASVVWPIPLGWSAAQQEIYPEGFTPSASGKGATVATAIAGLDYFETMRIPVVEGRTFSRRDADVPASDSAPGTVVVNQTLAERYWPRGTAVGRAIRLDSAGGELVRVVGVVRDGKYRQLGEPPQPHVYLPYPQRWNPTMDLVVRTAADPEPLLAAVRREIRAADPNLPISGLQTLERHMTRAYFPARAGATVIGLMSLIALALASLGLYSMMAYTVSQRSRELGIRMALGAGPGAVGRMIVAEGMRLTWIGLAVGIAMALPLARAVGGMLYGVSPTDPLVFLGITLLLSAVALAATYVPARRITRLDPLIALKAE